MSYRTIDIRAVELALEKVEPTPFEKFSQAFYGAVQGTDYVPLGGMHDGGAEGFELSHIFESSKIGRFMQASVTGDARSKIRQTVRRLRDFGRELTHLSYVTSQIIPHIDVEEDSLSEELGVQVRIRDRKYLSIHINESPKTVQAYDSYLLGALGYLEKFGSAGTVGEAKGLPARALCVFLGQEIDRRRGNTQLLESVTDSLILWALEGTDPDKKIFLNRREILEKVEGALPSASQFIRGVLGARLERLSEKSTAGGRAIRWYKKQDLFCLPYETRELVRAENTEDELLRLKVDDVFRGRIISALGDDVDAAIVEDILRACHRTLEITFENQGLEVSYFLTDEEADTPIVPSIYDHLELALNELKFNGNNYSIASDVCIKVLNGTFYNSSDSERLYLGKMSRTYIMMFILKNDVKVVEYFRNMSGNFILYIGADLLIRALSEYFLDEADQMTINTFRILKSSGSDLVLTEKCLEEVWSHLKATDAEFVNNYSRIEPHLDMAIARSVDRILIRAYLYARLKPINSTKRPSGWRSYIENFVDYKTLHAETGFDQLRKYLIAKFGFSYEDTEEMSDGIDPEELRNVTKDIFDERWRQKNTPDKERMLAENDALQVLRVYSRRKMNGEKNKANPYGYKTWWLTQANSIRRATGEVVSKYKSKYMMRPEFLLHFISMSPTENQVRKSFNTVFPTILGIRLSNRLDKATFVKAIYEIGEAYKVDEARALVKLSELSNHLQSDFLKQYH